MTSTTAAELIARSNRLGADPKNNNYAGGNTSAKGTETDSVTGEQRTALKREVLPENVANAVFAW